MNDEMKQAFDSAKNLSLTERERLMMRNHLHALMIEHPATAPWHIRMLDRLERLLEKTGSFQMRGIMATAFAFVLVIGVGTSYAAESALPGDALYPVKIYLNEPIAGSFAHSDAAQANWDTELVSRRLAEAEQLAAQGKLTPVARAAIQAHIALSTADFNEKVAKLAASADSSEVAQAQSDLESSLVGHEQVLAALTDDTDEGKALAPVLAMVSVHKSAAANSRAQAEAAVEHGDRGAAKAAALATKQMADQAIHAATIAISNAGDQNATTTASAHVSVALAKHTADEGDTHLEHGDYGKAFATFQAATREAHSTEVHVSALEHLGSSFFENDDASSTATSTGTSTNATSSTETDK